MMEVIRQKFLDCLVDDLALFMSSALLQFIDLSDQNVKFIADFGVGMIQLWDTFGGCSQCSVIFSGLKWDDLTLHQPMLAVEYGKICAIQLLMLCCLTLMSGTWLAIVSV